MRWNCQSAAASPRKRNPSFKRELNSPKKIWASISTFLYLTYDDSPTARYNGPRMTVRPTNSDAPDSGHDATALLSRASDGDESAAEALLPLVYDQLRALAGSYFRGQAVDQTLQPTALVHEAYLKLIRSSDGQWKDRVHFCAVAATAMRQILHDRARRRRAAKRGGDAKRVPMDHLATNAGDAPVDLIALDDAMQRLSDLDARQARIVELRFFGGLTTEEVGSVLNLSGRTIQKEWRRIRAWLGRELEGDETQ